MKMSALLATVALLVSPACFAQLLPKLPCGDQDQQCALQAMLNHETRRLESWQAMIAVPVGERIGPAPPQLVEYLNLDNIKNGYPERPRAALLDAGFVADVKTAFAELPASVRALVEPRLAGLFFVEDLGGTGYTEYVRDLDGKPVAAFVVFDAAILGQRTANAWATWKENTPFMADPGFDLVARIETDSGDSRKNAIQYILLHELAHVIAVVSGIHPPWDTRPDAISNDAEYPFVDLSWQINRDEGKFQSIFDADFPQRSQTSYYFGARLSAVDMLPAYLNLANTNFVSLYAATNPYDDFAESFASFVHVVVMGRPWQIGISRDGEEVFVLNACWSLPRCREKEAFLQQLLESPP